MRALVPETAAPPRQPATTTFDAVVAARAIEHSGSCVVSAGPVRLSSASQACGRPTRQATEVDCDVVWDEAEELVERVVMVDADAVDEVWLRSAFMRQPTIADPWVLEVRVVAKQTATLASNASVPRLVAHNESCGATRKPTMPFIAIQSAVRTVTVFVELGVVVLEVVEAGTVAVMEVAEALVVDVLVYG